MKTFAQGINVSGWGAVKAGTQCLVDAVKTDMYRHLGFPQVLPTMVAMKVTFKCNSRCTTCYIWQNYLREPEKVKEEMTFDEFLQFMKVNPHMRDVALSGGEPFCRDDIGDMWKVLDDYGYRTGGNTNAVDIDHIMREESAILKRLSGKNIRYLTISTDGIGDAHDKIRGVKGNFDNTMKLLAWCQEREKEYPFYSVGLSYTISPENVDDFPGFIDFALSKGVDPYRINFRTVQEAVVLCRNTGKVDPFSHAERVIAAIEKVQAAHPEFKHRYFVEGIKQYMRNPEKLVIPCYMGYTGMFIDPYWNVYACPFIDEVVCNLKDYDFSLKKAWECAEVKKTQQQIKSGDCYNCWGGCTAVKSAVSGVGNLLRLGWVEKWRLLGMGKKR